MTAKLGPLFSLFIFLLIPAATSKADKGDVFNVNPHARFYAEAVPYLNQGTKLWNDGDLKGAKQCFDSAIRIDRNIWPAYIDRAQILAKAGQLDLALQDCNTASRLRPDFYRTFIVRAEIYRRLGRCREALADLDRIISFRGNPETEALALSRRAVLRATCKDSAVLDPRQALADAEQACRMNPKAVYKLDLAIAYAANGDLANAITYDEMAIKTGRLSDDELREAKDQLSRYQRREHP